MRRILTTVSAGLLVLAVVAPVFAWEFSMTVQHDYRFKYFARMGNSDLFGLAPAQDEGAGTFIGFAGPNIWSTGAVVNPPSNLSTSVAITRGGFARWGSDAHYSDNRVSFSLDIRVNPAIRWQGVYTIGGYRNKWAQYTAGVGTPPFERTYMQGVSDNAYDTAGIGSWEQFRVTAQTPIAILSFGVKDFGFGTGATLSKNTRTEAFVTTVPYGPFSFIHGIWLSQGAATDGFNESPDGGRKNTFFQGVFLVYNAADLQVGGCWIGRNHHMGRGDLGFPNFHQAGPVLGEVVATDTSLKFWLFYLKYNNGRFFANAEYSWVNIDTYKTLYGGPTTTATTPSPSYSEYQHAFAEAGLLSGPVKTTFVWAWAPGQNLANPLNTPAGTLTTKSTPYPVNYQAMEPYNTLMFHTFAGGNNQFTWVFGADGTGLMGDAWALGARLDYALASNLNVWSTYLWAERLERDGYLAGQFGASGTPDAVNGAVAAGATFRALRGGTDPFASSRFLGWEADAGVDWKLLEGMTMHFKYAYWQPGDWFDWAYQAALPGGVTGPLGKSPILSLQGSILVDF
ncbi:MAG: hypothetical protein ACLQPD_34705 [Desulfomonilaceae bacterium]